MFACTGLLEEANMLASAVTFVTYIREVPASNLGRDIDCPRRFFFFLGGGGAHSHHADARIVSYGCDDRVFVGSF
jgi:hypothetical protein